MSLTSELDRPGGLLGRYLRERFPLLRLVQGPYREAAAALVPLLPPEGARIAYGTVGTAFDWRVRFLLHPQPDLRLAFLGAGLLGRRWMALAGELAGEVGGSLHLRLGGSGPGAAAAATPATAPAAGGPVDRERLVRACYALALFTEVLRAGPLPGSPLGLLPATATVDDLLALAGDGEVVDLLALTEAARESLLPAVAIRGGPLRLGPTFAGSLEVGGADADLIAGGLLLELKVQLGDKTKDGRRCSLERRTLFELLGYLLLDYDDAYQVDTLGVYSARWRYLVTWPVGELLAELAGGPVDLAEERAAFAALIRAEVAPRYAADPPPARRP